MKKKTLLLTGTSGFVGYNFLKYALANKYQVIDILRKKNKNLKKLKDLKKRYNQNYKTIFFSNYQDLKKNIDKVKIDYFINFATFYRNKNNYEDIFRFIDSNILFPTLIYSLINQKVKKIINFGTMMQHTDGKNFKPNNLYAATKNAFEMIGNFYSSNKKVFFYNIKFYESFGLNDERNKILPTIIRNYKKNKITKILSKDLELNIIHINDIINAIEILLNKTVKSGSYCLKQNKNIKIKNIIEYINKSIKKKIKVKYYNKSVNKIIKSKIKTLPGWKVSKNLMKKISESFLNEIN